MRPAVSTALVAALAATALALTGCAPASTSGKTPEPGATKTATPTRSGTPSPAVTARPRVDELRLGPDGLVGPDDAHSLPIGHPVPKTDGTTALAAWDPRACLADGADPGGPEPGDRYAGSWSSVYPTGPGFSGGTDTAAFLLDSSGTERGDVDWLVVLGTAIGTTEGVHVGDPASAVAKAYPKPAGVVHLGLSDVYVVAGRTGQLTIEVTTDDGSGYWRKDEIGRVFALSARPAGSDPVGLVATDNVPGCKA